NIARHYNTLTIRYAILGHLAELVIPAPTDKPARKNKLWQETCFEFFLAPKNSPQYWEFNLSPAGHWNVYRFVAYRQEMQAKMAVNSLSFIVQNQEDALLLMLELDLDKLVLTDQFLQVAISAVIKPKNGELAYWALIHCAPQADFHRRDSFLIEL
ncbi:MAG: DOMON-like domain-containing protein, partial [Microcystaceae cyanobacterium]